MGRQDTIIDRLVDEGIVSTDRLADLDGQYDDDPITGLLLEEHLAEEVLLEQMALHFDRPPAGYREGIFVERDLLERLEPELIRRYEVLPVRRRQDGRIDVLVVSPLNDLAHQIVEEKLGKPLRQYLWPKLRYLQARHFFLGDQLPAATRDYLTTHPVRLGYSSSNQDVDVVDALQSSASLHVLQWHRQDVQEFITSCFDRDTLLKVLLGYAGHWMTNRLVVIFARGGVQPYFMEEWPELSERFDEVSQLRQVRADLPTDAPIRQTEKWQADSADNLGLSPLCQTLGVDPPSLLISLPVVIGGRTAMSLVGVPTDRDSALRLDNLSDNYDLQGLADATQWVGSQLEELIKRAKAGTLPPPAERVPALPQPQIQLGLGVEESLVEQTMARRREGQKRHRWEIVDISHVVEDSSAASESMADESSVADAVAAALSEVSEDNGAQHEPAPSQPTPGDAEAVDTGATSFGMPALQLDEAPLADDSSEIVDDNQHHSEPAVDEELSDHLVEASDDPSDDDSDVDKGWSNILSEVSEQDAIDQLSEASLGAEGSDALVPDTQQEQVVASPKQTAPDELIEPADELDDRPPTSDVLVDHALSDSEKVGDDSPKAHGPTTDETLKASSFSELSEPSAEAVDNPTSEAIDEPDESDQPDELSESSSQAVDETDESGQPDADRPDELSESSSAADEIAAAVPSQLNIPTSRSGVPMAQILRRPRTSRKNHVPSGVAESSQAGASEDFDRQNPPTTGQTIMGLGDVAHLGSLGNSPSATSDAADASSWLDEVDPGAEPSDPAARPSGTVKMNTNVGRTQSFGELLEDMDSEPEVGEASQASEVSQTQISNPNSVVQTLESGEKDRQVIADSHSDLAVDDDEKRPQTVPVEAIEEISETGPQAVEIEESLALLDSRDQDTAFAAAEHLAVAGQVAIKSLIDHFPGRIYVDRYQYNLDTMPAVNEHGPVLEALVRIGSPSLKVVQKYLEDSSLQCRFYATFLLTELPAHTLLGPLQKRLFDRDQQTRDMAGRIIYAHRHLPDFEELVVEPLRQTLADNDEEFRVEIAAKYLRRLRDLKSVSLLIDALAEHPPRVRDVIHGALKEITFQPLSPSPSEWRRWWFDASEQPRWQWLVAAMNSDDEAIRFLAFDEISQLPGLDLDFHPDQPQKLRARAQSELTHYFESQL